MPDQSWDDLLKELSQSERDLLTQLSKIQAMQHDLMNQEGIIRKGLMRVMIQRSRIKSAQDFSADCLIEKQDK